jgi:peptide/nickel transport system substrate-binding protein
VVAQPADIRSTNPGVNRDNTTDGVVLNIVEGLVGYHENGTSARCWRAPSSSAPTA